jgi:hypothetical protein
LGFPPLGTTAELLSPSEVDVLISNLFSTDLTFWQISAIPTGEELTWYLAGTLAENELSTESAQSTPFTLALVLEEHNLPLAEEIGHIILNEVMNR